MPNGFVHDQNAILYTDGNNRVLAEVDFPQAGPGVVDINHTYVSPSLRGQGIADKLLSQAVGQLRDTGMKAVPSCSYAKKWFSEHPDASDVLA